MTNHVINKLTFSIPAENYQQAQQHQAATRQWAIHSFPVMINEYLNELNTDDELLLLDKIELEIPDFPWALSHDQWKVKLHALIKNPITPGETFTLVFSQWIFFLKNGYFKTSFYLKAYAETEAWLLSHISLLSRSLVIQHFTSPFQVPFLQRLFLKSSEKLCIVCIKHLFRLNDDQGEKCYTLFQHHLNSTTVSVQSLFIHLYQLIEAGKYAEKDGVIDFIIKNKFKAVPGDTRLLKKQDTGTTVSKSPPPLEDEWVHCELAGLVLLFPYLQRFFENTGLADSLDFIDDACRNKAIQSLYFLASGKDTGEEEEYLLPKLLCGAEAEEYLEFKIELPVAIKDEANDLLNSVIGHWSKLQSTSVDALRETFLLRTGKLKLLNSQYILKVEESGVDILLGTIPWGFRNYKLPWMNFSLITEWY